MNVSETVLTVFSVQITWLHLFIGCGMLVLLALYIWLGILRERQPNIHPLTALADAVAAAAARPGDMLRFLTAEVCLLLMCFVHLLFLLSPDELNLGGTAVPLRVIPVSDR